MGAPTYMQASHSYTSKINNNNKILKVGLVLIYASRLLFYYLACEHFCFCSLSHYFAFLIFRKLYYLMYSGFTLAHSLQVAVGHAQKAMAADRSQLAHISLESGGTECLSNHCRAVPEGIPHTSPSAHLPPARHHFLKNPKPPNPGSLSGDQLFTNELMGNILHSDHNSYCECNILCNCFFPYQVWKIEGLRF